MANNARGCSSSSAYSTYSTSSMRRHSPAAADFDVPANTRPTFSKSRSCQDLIVWGTSIQPAAQLPPPEHLRRKFTTLAALGTKPTTKPLPFSFSMSTMCDDGSCRRFISKKQRLANVPTFESVVTQHARIARNIDALATRVRKIFHEPTNSRPGRHQRLEPIDANGRSMYGGLMNGAYMMGADGPSWDLGELVKNADALSRNLAVSQHVLNELLNARSHSGHSNNSNSRKSVDSLVIHQPTPPKHKQPEINRQQNLNRQHQHQQSCQHRQSVASTGGKNNNSIRKTSNQSVDNLVISGIGSRRASLGPMGSNSSSAIKIIQATSEHRQTIIGSFRHEDEDEFILPKLADDATHAHLHEPDECGEEFPDHLINVDDDDHRGSSIAENDNDPSAAISRQDTADNALLDGNNQPIGEAVF